MLREMIPIVTQIPNVGAIHICGFRDHVLSFTCISYSPLQWVLISHIVYVIALGNTI